MLEPYEQRSFNHPLIGLYEKLKMNSGCLAFCYRYHSTELSKYFCVSVVSLSLSAPLYTCIFINTKIREPWSQTATLPFRIRWQLHFWSWILRQFFQKYKGGGYVLGRLLCYEVVCFYPFTFDRQRPKGALIIKQLAILCNLALLLPTFIQEYL